MDPITLAIIAGLLNVGPAIGGALASAGPAAAVVGPAAASVAPAAAGAAATAPIWVPAAGTGAAVAAGAGSVGAGAAVATNPVATQGVEAWGNDIYNNVSGSVINTHNGSAAAVNDVLPPEVGQIPLLGLGY